MSHSWFQCKKGSERAQCIRVFKMVEKLNVCHIKEKKKVYLRNFSTSGFEDWDYIFENENVNWSALGWRCCFSWFLQWLETLHFQKDVFVLPVVQTRKGILKCIGWFILKTEDSLKADEYCVSRTNLLPPRLTKWRMNLAQGLFLLFACNLTSVCIKFFSCCFGYKKTMSGDVKSKKVRTCRRLL